MLYIFFVLPIGSASGDWFLDLPVSYESCRSVRRICFISFLFCLNQLNKMYVATMKETPRRIKTVTSSLNEIPRSAWKQGGWGLLLPIPPLSTASFWTIFRKMT